MFFCSCYCYNELNFFIIIIIIMNETLPFILIVVVVVHVEDYFTSIWLEGCIALMFQAHINVAQSPFSYQLCPPHL